jgi:hypothetical protein
MTLPLDTVLDHARLAEHLPAQRAGDVEMAGA